MYGKVQRLRREQERRRAAAVHRVTVAVTRLARLPRIDVGAVRRELAHEIEARQLVAMLGPRQVEAARPAAHARDLVQRGPAVDGGVRIRAVRRAARSRLRSSGSARRARACSCRRAAWRSDRRPPRATPSSRRPRRRAPRNASAVNSPVASRASRSAPALINAATAGAVVLGGRPHERGLPAARFRRVRRRRRPQSDASIVATSPVRAAVISNVSPSANTALGSAPASSSARIIAASPFSAARYDGRTP